MALVPSRPVIAFQQAIREAAPLVAFEVPTTYGPQSWPFRDPGRSLVARLSHLRVVEKHDDKPRWLH